MIKRFIRNKEAGILLLIGVITVIISLNNRAFLSPENLIDMMKGNTVLAIMSLGMLLVIVGGGIDVSVSATIAAVTVMVGRFLVDVSGNVLLGFCFGCLSGTLIGAVNGILISKLKIPPIVATLGTMSIINGSMLYFTNGAWINDIPETFNAFGSLTFFTFKGQQGGVIGIPVQLVFLLGAAVVTWIILRYTQIGRGIYAAGGNPGSAVRIGYELDRIYIFTYMYMGFLTGLAGVVHTSIMKQVDPNAFSGFELQVIAAVVLGGANILGGAGTVFGTLLGVLLVAVMSNGLILMHIPIFWQKIITGIVILIAVSFDVIQRKRAEKSLAMADIE